MRTDPMRRRPSRAAGGFTLVELLIVVAIVAILAAIANASYDSYVLRSRRAAAATCLQERAHFMERYYTTQLSYAGAPNPAQCGADLDSFYTIAFNGTPGAKAFTLTATPIGTQQRDSKCGTLSINAQGARTASGSGSVADCW
ncbi:type IV pilin protein [Pseudoxanthomonas sp. 10H]|uniref:type IV pilin protein n=1 Tax=Pseudoxanthomonas sp. 10H TaxID=3242729 RepID=UPI0035565468